MATAEKHIHRSCDFDFQGGKRNAIMVQEEKIGMLRSRNRDDSCWLFNEGKSRAYKWSGTGRNERYAIFIYADYFGNG